MISCPKNRDAAVALIRKDPVCLWTPFWMKYSCALQEGRYPGCPSTKVGAPYLQKKATTPKCRGALTCIMHIYMYMQCVHA